MRINNNIPAINSSRISGVVNGKIKKSIQKLSSGLRINQASDDVAGLSISVKMRAQIRGINQASRNTQDGISLIQTAEGALETVHELLQRGREISVQAANGTNTEEDRERIQAEMDQIVKEVDRIANTTEFNTKNLLNVGKSASSSLIETITNGLQSGWLQSGVNLIQTYFGLNESNRTIDVVFDTGAIGGDLASIQTGWSIVGNTSTITSMELHIDLADFDPSTGPDGENSITTGGGTMYNDRIIAHEMVHAVMADQLGDDFYDMETWFKEGSAELIHGADDRVEGDGIVASVARGVDLIDGTAGWSGTSLDYSGSYVALKFIQSNLQGGSTMADIFSAIQDGDDANDNTMNAIIANTSFADVADFKAQLLANGATILNIDAGAGETDTGSIGGSDHGGGAKSPTAVVPNGGYSANPTNFNFDLPDFGDTEGTIKIHVGANSSQNLTVSLANVTSSYLGIDSVDMVNDASLAITTLDNAIENVSDIRSNFGAIQNRLEHNLKINENYAENLQASESRIRDVDMAKEMMSLTKNDILSKAAQVMMAQANQKPQGILQLVG